MKLAIISHTEHYILDDGTIVGWGPTVQEINNLLEIFDEIYHVAMIDNREPPKSAVPYNSDKIIFVPIKKVGGPTIKDKFSIIFNLFDTLRIINRTLKKVDSFQFRAPTGIGLYTIPFLTYMIKKKGWFKYAGNYNQAYPPLGYRIQRAMLKNQRRIVTINGRWPNQLSNFLTFENPCLTDEDLIKGTLIGKHKNFSGPLNFCFVGRLEDEKGVSRIIEAFLLLDKSLHERIGQIVIIGNGKKMEYYKSMVEKSAIKFLFYGSRSREEVFNTYKVSHFLLLPTTASEGFPKVIAEAMNFGCIPIVSNISSIEQYIIDKELGFILKDITATGLSKLLTKVITFDFSNLNEIITKQHNLVKKFTFSHYNFRIKNDILKNKHN